MKPRQPKVVRDAAHPGMSRVRWPDGRLSDMTNLTRAKDAVTCFIETEERRQRRRHSPSAGRLCVKIDSWGKGPRDWPRQPHNEVERALPAREFMANKRNDIH